MTEGQYQHVKRLFHEALELPAPERRRFVASLSLDPPIAEEVQSLLQVYEASPPDFLETGADRLLPCPVTGCRLGAWLLVREIGRGGMGVVWEARRADGEYEQRAAVKLLRTGLLSEPDIIRFRKERQILAALDHPGIARLLDGGATDDGVPYLVMEFIEGEDLDTWCERRNLAVRARLELFLSVCEAVAYAHGQHVVHRDLKPANILVSKGATKLLDFGIARILDGGAPANPATTRLGLTPQYASPEQVRGKTASETTDVYSLGVILFKLLTGGMPYPVDGEDALKAITAVCECEPALPSSVAANETAGTIRGDLDAIVLKCLRKEPSERYASAEALAADIRAWLDGLPVVARSRPWRRLVAARFLRWQLAVAAMVSALGLLWWSYRSMPSGEWRLIPFTTYAGIETNPSFSPDGETVAFSWEGPQQDNVDIYVQRVGSGSARRLTTDSGEDVCPAWSPDGRWIAFLRWSGPVAAVMLIPSNGGPERKVADSPGPAVAGVAWTPDGKWLVAPQRPEGRRSLALYLLSVETGEKRKLTSPPQHFLGDRFPAFSPRGDVLAFSRGVLETVSDVYLLRLSRDYQGLGEPVRLTSENGWRAIPSWTADGREIVYSTGAYGAVTLHRISVSGGTPQPLRFGGLGMDEPAISRRGRRLAYVAQMDRVGTWRIDLTPANRPASSPSRLAGATRMDQSPEFSPDGKRIALASNRLGSWEIWVTDADGKNAVQVTRFNGPFLRFPRWSPDSRQIVFDVRAEGQADIYVINTDGSGLRRLTSDQASDVTPAWSKDGSWIYFASSRSGRIEIWRIPASGGEASQVTNTGGLEPRESPDGRYVYFMSAEYLAGAGWHGLWRVPVGGGLPTAVIKGHLLGYSLSVEGIFFLDASTKSIRFLKFLSGEISVVAALPVRPQVGLSFSPGARSLAYVQQDVRGSDLMLVEDFR